jgi:hypothetical protein
MVLAVLTGWLDRQERKAVAYLIEENRILRRSCVANGTSSPITIDAGWRVHGHRLGRQILRQIASVVAPDTIMRWHRQLIVRKWTSAHRGHRRCSVLAEIRRLLVRMADENPKQERGGNWLVTIGESSQLEVKDELRRGS